MFEEMKTRLLELGWGPDLIESFLFNDAQESVEWFATSDVESVIYGDEIVEAVDLTTQPDLYTSGDYNLAQKMTLRRLLPD